MDNNKDFHVNMFYGGQCRARQLFLSHQSVSVASDSFGWEKIHSVEGTAVRIVNKMHKDLDL